MMRFYRQQHGFYCGVDLHARTLHVCVVDDELRAAALFKNGEKVSDREFSENSFLTPKQDNGDTLRDGRVLRASWKRSASPAVKMQSSCRPWIWFPLGLPQWDRQLQATYQCVDGSSPSACPDGSSDSLARQQGRNEMTSIDSHSLTIWRRSGNEACVPFP